MAGRNLEWLMHFFVPKEGAKKYFPAGVLDQVAQSAIKNAGEGLFTTKARKNGELICEFPGFWIPTTVCWGKAV